MARALGPGIGGFLAGLHREQGVVFHLRATARGFDGSVLTLEDGTTIAADMLVVGVGVSPRTQLAAAAGLDVDNGIRSEEHTSELQSLMRISYAVFCLKKKKKNTLITTIVQSTYAKLSTINSPSRTA